MNLENLFSNLLDESRRQSLIDTNSGKNKVLFTKRAKKPLKDQITKAEQKKYCNKCKTTQHSTSNCWYLNPDKKPKWFKTGSDYDRPPGYKEDLLKRQPPDSVNKALINDVDELDTAENGDWN
jgi:hypothetical protein